MMNVKAERIYAQTDLGALNHNMACMRRCLGPDTKICAVIKADAYGHGAVPIARHLEGREDIWGFAVAAFSEAMALRESGIKKPILLLGYGFPEDYEKMIKEGIRPAVFSLTILKDLSKAAKRSGASSPVPIHLAVDTGMTRIGFPDTKEAAKDIANALGDGLLEAEGLFSHFARCDEADKSCAQEALGRFRSFAGALKEEGIAVKIRHIANSAGILEFPAAHLDMVRAGITLYGIYPSDEMRRDKDLRPVMSLKSRVIFVKEVESGVQVSYGGTYVTTKKTKIATISAGYADGYPRSLSNRASVLIRGKRVPVIGRICMDQFMADVTELKDLAVGDEVTLLGRDGEEEITVEELGALSGRFPYEFVCDIGKRVPRRIVDDNP